MRRTKIVCTLGPATDDYTVLKSMVRAGMNVARLNFSHGTYDEHKARIDMVKRARRELDAPIAIMLDTKGPEIRIKTFKTGSVELKSGQKFVLTSREVEGDPTCVSVTFPELCKYVKKGARILVNDGLIELVVESTNATDIVTTVKNDGVLSNRKSINLPDTDIDMPYLSDIDRADIEFGLKQDVDYIAMSFVRTVDDVRIVKKLLNEHDKNDVQLIAKIENRSGVDNMDSILRECDGLMVARGDMGVEIPFEELPGIQKRMISHCYTRGKKVITATQMLESMITNPRPTRAEISDVANAIYDGSSAIMLSGETAAGAYPVEAVRTMASIAESAESNIDYKERFRNLDTPIKTITDAVSHSICAASFDLDIKAIIAVSQSGYTARKLSRFRPSVPIIAATTSVKAYNQLAMNWGVMPTLSKMQENSDALFRHAMSCALNTGLVTEGDLVVVAAGVPVGVSGNTNTMRIDYVKKF